AIAGRWQALDILVLNAATLGSLAPVPVIEGKEFASVMTLNVLAQHNAIAAFDPLLRASTSAAVIGVTSSVATSPRAY
ncbi:SDR family NAD(P)-dependent oxidoreductase, partial [Acinetobacter baumannii]